MLKLNQIMKITCNVKVARQSSYHKGICTNEKYERNVASDYPMKELSTILPANLEMSCLGFFFKTDAGADVDKDSIIDRYRPLYGIWKLY